MTSLPSCKKNFIEALVAANMAKTACLCGGLLSVVCGLVLLDTWITGTGLSPHPALQGWALHPLTVVIIMMAVGGCVFAAIAVGKLKSNRYQNQYIGAFLCLMLSAGCFFSGHLISLAVKANYVAESGKVVAAYDAQRARTQAAMQLLIDRCIFLRGEVIASEGQRKDLLLSTYQSLNCSMDDLTRSALGMPTLDAPPVPVITTGNRTSR